MFYCVHLIITEFYDDSQPGWVEAHLIDAWKRKWSFREKTVSLSSDPSLSADSSYPCDGELECYLVGHYLDRDGRHVAIIRTTEECTDRTYLFEVEPSSLFNTETGEIGCPRPETISPLGGL